MNELLQNFLDEHYIGSEKDELIELLGKYELISILNQAVSFQYQLHRIRNIAPIAQLMPIAHTYASTALAGIDAKLSLVNETEEKVRIRVAIAKLGLRFLLSFFKTFPEQILKEIDVLKDNLPEWCNQLGINYSEIEKHINIGQLKEAIREISGAKFSEDITHLPTLKEKRLIWTEKFPLDFLSAELKRKKWIKRKNQWSDFLDVKRTPGLVLCDKKFKYEISRLLFVLYEGDFIRPIGSKGYFTIAQYYLRDYAEKEFAINTLKKISFKICKETNKHHKIINEVDSVMRKVFKK